MKTIKYAKAHANLNRLLEETSASHEPIQIVGKSASGVLVAEDDWRAIQETLYLLSVPGMRESIQEGMQASPAQCSTELTW